MPKYLIPMVYAGAAVFGGLTLPRLEHHYFPSYFNDISVSAALSFLGAIGSGMMALTAIVFSIAYVTVQFNAIAYSPRLALWFADDPRLFHAMGLFIATFLYALASMIWVDRAGSGGMPLFSGFIVVGLVLASMWMFTLLIRGLFDLQVSNTLHIVADKGRDVIEQMYPVPYGRPGSCGEAPLDAAEVKNIAPATRTIKYFGKPKTISSFDVAALIQLATQTDTVIELGSAGGDTVGYGTVLVTVHGGTAPFDENVLLRFINLKRSRTFEQDPKYALRLLVDIAIKALSPAINDPTTAVQAIDQIEDLLHRLGGRELNAGYARDANGILRVIFPMPSWEDYLHLAFDEIRQYGDESIQVMRRLRSALISVADVVVSESRTAAMQKYLRQLDTGISRSRLDDEDRLIASQEDRQGLGISRKRLGRATLAANLHAAVPHQTQEIAEKRG